jgi:alpha-1,2-mannosyltransferase
VATHTTVRLAVVGAVAAAASYVVFGVVTRPPLHEFFDLRVYRGAVTWWLHGRPLYSFATVPNGYGFTYPPFAAILMVPLAWLTSRTSTVLTVAASVAVIVTITARLVAPVARRHGRTPWFAAALAVPVVLTLEPIRDTLGYGQLNMLLFALVMADLLALRRGWAWAGAGIGLATAIKLTPGLFIVFLFLIGKRRSASVATGTSLGATLLAFVVDGAASWHFWTNALWDTSRVGRLEKPSNQSVMGVLAHVADPGQPNRAMWAVLAGAVLILGMWRAVRVYRRGDDLVAFTVVGLTACLVSPISWTHHLYWIVPAVVVLVDVAAGTPLHATALGWSRRRRRMVAVGAGVSALTVVLAFIVGFPWLFHQPTGALTAILGTSSYAVLMVALVVLLPVRRTVPLEERHEDTVALRVTPSMTR